MLKFIFDFKFLGFSSIFSIFLLVSYVTSKGYPCSLIKTTDVTWIESERNPNARIMPKSKFIKSSRRKYNQRMTTLQLA